MPTVAELDLQIEELVKQRNEAIAGERKSIIQEIKKQIKSYSLTAKELGFGKEFNKQQTKPERVAVIKYKNGDLTWSGRGRKPEWVKEAGGDIEKYRVA